MGVVLHISYIHGRLGLRKSKTIWYTYGYTLYAGYLEYQIKVTKKNIR